MKRTIAALAVSLLTAACATAPTPLGFANAFPVADSNDTDAVSRKEFDDFWADTKLFKRADHNGDKALSPSEYQTAVASHQGYFNQLDTNKDGVLTRFELLAGWYDLFDADKTGTLSRDEFARSLEAWKAKP